VTEEAYLHLIEGEDPKTGEQWIKHRDKQGTFPDPDERAAKSFIFWRRKRDSNPRTPSDVNGFQDRRLQPLGHSSDTILADKTPNQARLVRYAV
jgi:hypothetical protein